jgi:hypothetical protein
VLGERDGLDHAAEQRPGSGLHRHRVQRGNHEPLGHRQLQSGPAEQLRRLRAEHDTGRRAEHQDGGRLPDRVPVVEHGDPVTGPLEPLRPRDRHQPGGPAGQPPPPAADRLRQVLPRFGEPVDRRLRHRGEAGGERAHQGRSVAVPGQADVDHGPILTPTGEAADVRSW